jgi:hypothetical protein
MNASRNGYHGNGQAEPLAQYDPLPPQDPEAELKLLSGLMLDNKRFDEVLEFLEPEDFYRDKHEIVFRAMRDLHFRGIGVDGVTLANELKHRGQLDSLGGIDFLGEIAGAANHAENCKCHAEIIKQAAKLRNLIQGSTEIIRDAFSRRFTADELLDRSSRISSLTTEAEAERDELDQIRPWPEPIAEAGLQGLAGDIVRAIAPHSESDPIAILGQFLTSFGNVIGRKPHWYHERTRHALNLFLCVVGNSAKARKGTSWDHIIWLWEIVDSEWCKTQIHKGLSTGEGLIHAVRDPLMKEVKGEWVEVMSGVSDKRALFVETEFGGTLVQMNKDTSILSVIMRQGWDGVRLGVANKNTPSKATDAHISIIGHITNAELNQRLTMTDTANGFANRFAWLCARRSQFLPFGGEIHKVNFTDIVNRLRDCLEFVRTLMVDDGLMRRDHAANDLWGDVYPDLTEAKPGLLGSVISRSEAMVMRVAAIYALLDCSQWIRRHHLEAALAFWKVAEQSAAYIFGDLLGDPLAEKLLRALRDAGDEGLTPTQIHRVVFKGHKTKPEIRAILHTLMRCGSAHQTEMIKTDKPSARKGGHPGLVWKASITRPAHFAQVAQVAPRHDETPY